MSNRFDLLVTELAPGVSFACAYSRLTMGWDRARAVSTPPKKIAPRKTYNERMAIYHAKREKAVAKREERLFMWERAEWNKKVRLDKIKKPKDRRKSYYVPKAREEKAHPLLTAYCNEFIKTGVLNPEIAAKLKDYADANKRPVRDLARISPEHASESSRRRRGNRDGRPGRDATLDAAPVPA